MAQGSAYIKNIDDVVNVGENYPKGKKETHYDSVEKSHSQQQ